MSLLIRIELADGHTVEVDGRNQAFNWQPLGVSEFRGAVTSRGPIVLTLNDAVATVSGPVDNFVVERQLTFTFSQGFPLKVFGLVPGGWLPAAICESTLLLPDANLAGKFTQLDEEAPLLRATSVLGDVQLLGMGVGEISAVFAAFEGFKDRFPSREEYATHLKKLALRLQRGFPGRRVVFPSHTVVEAALALVDTDADTYRRYSKYLAQAYPIVSNRVEDGSLARRQDELEEIAKCCEIPISSFVHLLAIDCLYDDGPRPKQEQRPGRLVLKPKKVFSDENLFNALADVLHMERLCKVHSIDCTKRPVLCTMDHGLVQAWAMLSPSSFRKGPGSATVDLSVDSSFALRMEPLERAAFLKRMQESSTDKRS